MDATQTGLHAALHNIEKWLQLKRPSRMVKYSLFFSIIQAIKRQIFVAIFKEYAICTVEYGRLPIIIFIL